MTLSDRPPELPSAAEHAGDLLRTSAVPIKDALAEWDALPLDERDEVASGLFLEGSQSSEDLLLRARINNAGAWNDFLTYQELVVRRRLLPLLEAWLDRPISEGDRHPLGSALRNHHPDLLDLILKRLRQQKDAAEGNILARALVSYIAHDARPTYNAMLTRDPSRDRDDRLLELVDARFCALAEQITRFVTTAFPKLPADQADAILEALVLSRGVSILPAVAEALIAADEHLPQGSERKKDARERLLSLCRMEPRQAVIALPHLLAERLKDDLAALPESDRLEKYDRDLTRILTAIQRDALLRDLPANQAGPYLQRLTALAEQAQPRSFRLDLASAIWTAANMLSPTSPSETIQAFLEALERLRGLRYERQQSVSIETDTEEIRAIIERVSARLLNLIAFKKQQGP